MEDRDKEDREHPDSGVNEPNENEDDFLVGIKTENVKPTGVDDHSTGMGDDDYLGLTNRKDDDE